MNTFFSNENRRLEMKQKNYDKILKKIYGRIKYETQYGKKQMLYKISTYNHGMGLIPSKDYHDCTRYIVDKLIENGIQTQARAPLLIYINWERNLMDRDFVYKIKNNLDLMDKRKEKAFKELNKKESTLKEPKKKKKKKNESKDIGNLENDYLDMLLDF